MPQALFICTGNIIRSACAQAYLQQVYNSLCPGWHVESAGTHAEDGHAMHPQLATLLEQESLDTTQHQSQAINPELVKTSQIIIVMEQAHQAIMKEMFPMSCGKLFLFDSQGDVPDPLGESVDTYQQITRTIRQGTQQWAQKLNCLS